MHESVLGINGLNVCVMGKPELHCTLLTIYIWKLLHKT